MDQKKKAGLDLITYSVAHLIGGHIMSYLITILDNKVPKYTYSALRDSEKQTIKVINSAFVVDNL